MNDNELIKKILDGDKDLYAKIMDKYHNELFKYVYNMVNNYNETEDLLQEIFFKLYKHLKKFDSSKASFRTWMYRVSKNYVLNYLKSSKKRMSNVSVEYNDDINQASENIEEQAVNDEKINLILKAMEKLLKPKHYEIMHLYYFSNLTVKEISETLEIPDKTVYKAINTSIEKIKKEVA
ncbi:MAG: RNA polymerase sigma factor [Candidatus Izemoplasmatales bacterium]|nr:RNA polymerase sigma factor [Candidatus Izemoplasmatales bacterium]